jgi:integrase
VCGLRWDWEEQVPALDTTVFVVPGSSTKNKEDRLIILNQAARSVIENQRGKHSIWVFPYQGDRVIRMHNSAWRRARDKAAEKYQMELGCQPPSGIRSIRVHDLKHTFGLRLRAAGVWLETRRVLLGHKNGDITTHYSAPELKELIEAAERISKRPQKGKGLVLLQGSASG